MSKEQTNGFSELEAHLISRYSHIESGVCISDPDIHVNPEKYIPVEDLVILASIYTGKIAKSSTKAALNRIINNQKKTLTHQKKLWTKLTQLSH